MTKIAGMKLARPHVPAMDAILGFPFEVLNHGFVRVIDYMGDDAAIVQAARTSYGDGTKHISEDEALINYLLRMAHTSPFEMCEIKLHCKMPIFVARQWVRHRTASLNEYSARYSVLKDEFYFPERENIMLQSNSNKQGREGLLDEGIAIDWMDESERISRRVYGAYDEATKAGMARELARINLPVNIYTEWYWKINLHNLMHFLKLRADGHAQYEIRVYADVIVDIMKAWVPLTHAAWNNHVFNAVKFSGKVMDALREHFATFKPGTHDIHTLLQGGGVKGRELADTLKALGVPQERTTS